ncbi:MAG: phenylacetate--CoA ligase family protein [Oscillospiraceae bacterium]|nr:phenylacetate--CoA ligase family protein [Oscillospiraceae bacterium]
MSEGFTTPEDLVSHGKDYVHVGAGEIRRIVTLRSSGSTGERKRLYFTEGDLRRTRDFFRDGMREICRPGDRVAILMGSASPDGLGDLLRSGLEDMGADPALLGFPKDYEETAEALRQLTPDCLVGLPVQIRKLALLVPALRPRSVLLSGDYVSEAGRQTVSRIWNTKAFSHYGLTESGLGFAVQCPLLWGHHIRSDDFRVEIVDPDTGTVLPEGEWGEIVFTTLRREAMPLRRYRTGDLSRLLPGVCPCGKAGPRLDRVLGRISELKKPISIYALDEALLDLDEVLDYEAVLDGSLLSLTVEGRVTERVRERLRAACPGLELRLEAGCISPSTRKRTILMT